MSAKANHTAMLAAYAEGVPISLLVARFRMARKTIYWWASMTRTRRPPGWRGRQPAERKAPPPPDETPIYVPDIPLRKPVLPWYTEHPDPTPPPLADLVVRAAPVTRYQRAYVPLWPRGAHEEALCIG